MFTIVNQEDMSNVEYNGLVTWLRMDFIEFAWHSANELESLFNAIQVNYKQITRRQNK